MMTEEQHSREEAETMAVIASMGPKAAARLIRIADEDEKREWLFSLVRKSAWAVASFIAAFVVFWDQVKSFMKGLWQ